MRVLCWSETFWPSIGGVEVLTAQLLQALRPRGYEFAVVTSDSEWCGHGVGEYNGIPVHRFPFRSALANQNLEQLWQLRAQVAQLKRRLAPDLIHINALGSSAFFQHWTAAVWRVPCVLTVHSTCGDDSLQHDTLRGRTVRSANWVTAVSTAVLAEIHHGVPEVRWRSSVIHNAVDAPAHSPAPLPIDTPRLLCLGRLAPEKGFDLALTALAALRPRFPHLRMTIAGDGVDRSDLEQQAARLKLLDIVEFVGWVAPENVPALLNSATIVLMPSRREGLPLVGLQAALMARPVVGTRVGGMPELVVPEQTGLLVDKEDSAGLAEAIARLLQCGELAVQMGEAARRRAEEGFGWQRCVDAYDALYRKLVKGV